METNSKDIYCLLDIQEPKENNFTDMFPVNGPINTYRLKKSLSKKSTIELIDKYMDDDSFSYIIGYNTESNGIKSNHFQIKSSEWSLSRDLAQIIVDLYVEHGLILDKTRVLFERYRKVSDDVTSDLYL